MPENAHTNITFTHGIYSESLRIWQQNLNKSSDAQLDLLHRMKPGHVDVAVIQEPHINFLGNVQATTKWITVYPTGHRDRPDRTRALTMINKTSLSSNDWTQIDVDSPDIVAIRIRTGQGTLSIYNIYNDCTNDYSIDRLSDHL